MSLFSPKEQFRQFQQDSMIELAKHAESKWFSSALSTAMAQVSFQGATESELAGIRRFIAQLLNLHEMEAESVTFPKRTLPSYDPPVNKEETEQS